MGINNLPVYDKDKCTLFALGRNAMYAACQLLGLKPGDEVLTPAFDCDGSLQPFKALGLKLRFFRSDPYTFSVDIDDIKRKITPQTKLLHIINHFGMPQPWNKLLSLKKTINLPILEDNAYSLFSSFNGKPLGTFGDMSIFSLRKNLPMICGGMLRINNPRYTFLNAVKPVSWIHPTEMGSFLNILKIKLGWNKIPPVFRFFMRSFIPELEPPPPLYSEEEKGFPDWPLRDHIGREFSCDYLRPMSHLAEMQINKLSKEVYSEICAKKRKYYMYLSEKLKPIKGITLLWPVLPEGIVPFCLSLLIESKRDSFLRVLRKKYDVMAWPILPKAVIDRLREFPEVDVLGRKLLQINLSANNVRLPNFPGRMENLVREMQELSRTL